MNGTYVPPKGNNHYSPYPQNNTYENGQNSKQSNLVKIITAIGIIFLLLIVAAVVSYFILADSKNNVDEVQTVDELQIDTDVQTDYDYLVEIDDFIEYNVSYDITEDYISYESEEGNVYLYASYYQLEGDIPNLDAINLEIYDAVSYLSDQYLDEYENNDDSFSGEYYSNVTSYITFNDENTISIVLQESYQEDDILYFDLYSMNYDLITGTRIENSDILVVDEKFAQEFRDISNAQNGQSDAVDSLSQSELIDFLTDDACNIVFYSPKGIEIGYNYIYGDTDSGWITATIKDYDSYLR